MKALTLFMVYFGTFFFFFFAFSAFGLFWTTYAQSVTDGTWIFFYTLFLGWWIAIFPAIEYYNNNKDVLEEVFN